MVEQHVMTIGIAGMVLIIAGWVAGLSSVPPLRLSTLYLAGSILLTVYAILIGDLVFTALNALASLVAGLNVARALAARRAPGG